MSTDFLDAFERHRGDAELLLKNKRWPNADQLYGFAAECGLKAVMQVLGMRLRNNGAPKASSHRVHIDRLWSEFHAFAAGRGVEPYNAMLPVENPFSNWNTNQRYYRSEEITETIAVQHRKALGHVHRVVSRARLDGRL
ncbi:hypothetical protein [Oceanithermus sp.]